ncbi:hypothetical protein [Anaeromyxobacter diazotrophicus]|uniref:Uncharacterized protein n=1 Tax=Anaeromyxobacter diazotrophicus TaxID=2590199 RepID=A0A7I9VQA4_9BACT|nr:hypothetical protein [Anaeromyxobacter diazotrophicus]GEJ58592.1 hypothetical protein AMYX_33330 [Anaeromyxobacter diazotrophicus]
MATKALFLLFSLLAAPAFAEEHAPRPRVVFQGNVLYDELVYLSVLDLPRNARADPALARTVAAKLRSFLRRAGYELATVHAEVQGDQIAVRMDEGRLDKIVILGRSDIETIRFRLELSMPAGVFNRPALERQLRLLAARFRLQEYSYQLIPVGEQEGEEPTLDEPELVVTVPGEGEAPVVSGTRLRPGQKYELHILIASSPWSRGFSPDLSLDSPEGLGAGGHYRGQDRVLTDDRWEFRVRAAGNLRQHLDSDSSRPVLTRLLGQGRWFSPPVWTDSLRPSLTVRADMLSLQRSDLRLDDFHQATFAASLDASLFSPRLTVGLGLGVERRLLFSLVKATGANPLIDQTPRAQTRPYGEALARLVFNPGELRTDRKHTLDLEARAYTGSPSSDPAVWLRSSYQRRFPFGWHELWWQAHGTLLAGEVLFPDEESVGSHLHGFAGSDFARKLGSTGLEFRYSLLRDVIKVGAFYDQVLFGAIDRTTMVESLGAGGAGGPALHLLLADQFQIDVYLALGWSTTGATGFSPALTLRQVY